jgi:hypothetical protein
VHKQQTTTPKAILYIRSLEMIDGLVVVVFADDALAYYYYCRLPLLRLFRLL